MKKLLFIMPDLGGGGAEKVIHNLLHLLPRDKFHCSVLLFKGRGHLVDNLPSDVEVIIRPHKRLISAIVTLIRFIRKDYDLIISSGYHNPIIGILSYLMGTSGKVILRETSVIGSKKKRSKGFDLLRYLIPIVYNSCSKIIFQSKFGQVDFELVFNTKLGNARILVNPTISKNLSRGNSWGKNIFLVGRLEKAKGYDVALKAIKKSGLDNQIIEVFGTGSEIENLKRIAGELSVSEQVVFHGFIKNMNEHWQRAGLHILTPSHESFPNVVIEAAMQGVPSVCLNAPGGIFELFQLGPWGKLVSKVEELPEAILKTYSVSGVQKNIMRKQAGKVFAEVAIRNYIEALSGYESSSR
jgi:glycosyltransferase involved in cell wall biosynthesis